VTDSTLPMLQSDRDKVRPREGPGLLRCWRDLMREDVQTVFAKDPAAHTTIEVLTSYPGLHALWLHRLTHGLWRRHHPTLSRFLSHLNRFFTGVEIHPGAQIGRRFFIDHGAGVVIGETAEIGDDVLIYTGVVLGGTTSERVKRHPTIGNDVVIGSNAVILGNITVGDGAKVGSGSVVVESVPAGATVVGVPGRVVRINGRRPEPRDILDHSRLPDPVVETLRCFMDRIETLESQVRELRGITPFDVNKDGHVPLQCIWIADEQELEE